MKAGAILTVLLALVGALTLTALSLRQQRDNSIELIQQQKTTLERLYASIAESKRFVGERQLVDDNSGRTSFLDAESEAAAASELQSRLRRILEDLGLTFVSSRVLPTITENDVTLVGIRLDGTSELGGLQKGLHAFETTTPKLVIQMVTMVSTPVPPGAEKAQNTNLRWQFDVYAAMWSASQ